MNRILLGSTIPAFKMTDDGHWWQWLKNAELITEQARQVDHQVEWLAVLQNDARGREPFAALLDYLEQLLVQVKLFWFSLDIGADQIDSGNRLGAICTGRNLIIDHALRHGHDWIYFADADIQAPDDVLAKLLELDWPVCGAHVPTYCLDGPSVAEYTRTVLCNERLQRAAGVGDVRVHWTTAGSLMVARETFRRVPWRHDPDAGSTDDPATQTEMERLGWPTLVRHDVVCTHHPESIGALEDRHHDLAVYR